ncbi:MAG: enoyl-CoA hydratase-related protein [Acidimicrobiales bacterium]
MELKTTRWQVDGRVATLTLSRPQAHNAWTGRMHTELRHLLQLGETDPRIGAIVITGDPEGSTFCPGGDATALAGHAERGAYDPGTPTDLANPGYGVRDEYDADFAYFLGLDTVTIAAINGAAAGVGLALACWCDVRFVADDAKLTSAHGRLGLPAEYGLSWILPRLIGHGRATDILLTSRIVMGSEAADIGLANRGLATAEVLPTALAYARELTDTISPASLRATRQQLAYDATHDNPATSVRDAQRRLEHMMTQPDYREGTAALNERRTPRWPDS